MNNSNIQHENISRQTNGCVVSIISPYETITLCSKLLHNVGYQYIFINCKVLKKVESQRFPRINKNCTQSGNIV